MSKERVTVWLEEETVEMIEAAVQEAAQDPEIGDEVSKSMIVRERLHDGVQVWSGKVRDALPDEYLEHYELKYRKRRRKKKDYRNKLAAYWRQNVNRALTKFYDDEAAAPPSRVRKSMRSWRDELHDVKDDEEEIEADLAWLERKLQEYEENVEYAEAVPDQGFDRVSPEPSVGSDLYQLRPQAAEIVEDIERLADGDAYDADAIIDRLAADYGVQTEAVETIIDTMVRDDVDTRRALRGEHGEDGPDHFRQVVDPQALGEGSGLPELEDAEALEETDADDGDDDDPDGPDAADVVDVEASSVETTSTTESVEDLPEDAIVRKGGRSEDAVEAGEEADAEAAGETETPVEKALGESSGPDVPDGGLTAEDLTTDALIGAVHVEEYEEVEERLIETLVDGLFIE